MKDTLTISIKFKMTGTRGHEEQLRSLCKQYTGCLKGGMRAIIDQHEVNKIVDKEEKEAGVADEDKVRKVSGLTISRNAMSKETASNMRDSACNEVASTWRSYSALWDKQITRSFPTFKNLGYRFRLRERSLFLNPKDQSITIAIPGKKMDFGILGSRDMHRALNNCTHGAFDVLMGNKGVWFIRIFCKIKPHERQNSSYGPTITVHTGMNWCVCALASYPNGSYRFLFVPYFPLWGAKKKAKRLRQSLQSKGKVHKVKSMGEKEYRVGNWYYHTVTKKLSEWITVQKPNKVILGEHLGLRAKAKKGTYKGAKTRNYWLSNYAFRSILDKLRYKLLMNGIEFELADTCKLMTTKTCSKCGGETFGLLKRGGRLCKDCGKTMSNEWNALKNLLPEGRRRIKRHFRPEEVRLNGWLKCGKIEKDLKRILKGLCQKTQKAA